MIHTCVYVDGGSDNESAEDFFLRVQESTGTLVLWPSRLKIGAKSKKGIVCRVAHILVQYTATYVNDWCCCCCCCFHAIACLCAFLCVCLIHAYYECTITHVLCVLYVVCVFVLCGLSSFRSV